ncbi:ribosomal protein L15 [Acrasis kona]|uniref:Ribosomal protein L15 n=1 Tax=Acrasis kona TaxID=1008807 RepID=A0AAW2YWF8_9EUKA
MLKRILLRSSCCRRYSTAFNTFQEGQTIFIEPTINEESVKEALKITEFRMALIQEEYETALNHYMKKPNRYDAVSLLVRLNMKQSWEVYKSLKENTDNSVMMAMIESAFNNNDVDTAFLFMRKLSEKNVIIKPRYVCMLIQMCPQDRDRVLQLFEEFKKYLKTYPIRSQIKPALYASMFKLLLPYRNVKRSEFVLDELSKVDDNQEVRNQLKKDLVEEGLEKNEKAFMKTLKKQTGPTDAEKILRINKQNI